MEEKRSKLLKNYARTFIFSCFWLPAKFLLRLLSAVLFGVEAFLLFIPCAFLDVFLAGHRTPFHWTADRIGDLSEWLYGLSLF